MEKEFVPFDLTLKLIELGFNFKSLGGYVDGELFLWQDNDTTSFIHCEIEAPLWQQAFDFFRELGFEFSINYHEDYLKDSKKHVYEVNLEQRGTSIYHNITPLCGFETYEEARQACLEKLIELCKKK